MKKKKSVKKPPCVHPVTSVFVKRVDVGGFMNPLHITYFCDNCGLRIRSRQYGSFTVAYNPFPPPWAQ